MSVFFESGYSLPVNDQPLTHARIAHSGNWYRGDATPFITASGYFADGPQDTNTYEKWRPYNNAVPVPYDFSDAAWTKTGVTVSGALVSETATTGAHSLTDAYTYVAAEYVLSFDVYPAGVTEVALSAFDGTTLFRVYFDLPTLTVGTESNATGRIKLIDGKYRCEMIFTAAAGTGNFELRLSDGAESSTYLGHVVDGLLVYEAGLCRTNSNYALDFLVQKQVDYCVIGAHNLGTAGATLRVQYENSGWQNAASFTPTDDSDIMVILEPRNFRRWRLDIQDARLPGMGILKFGKAMQMPQAIYGGHSPLIGGRQTEMRSNVSTTGEFLGRTKVRTSLSGSFDWTHLKPDWVRTNWIPFQRAIEEEPFFIAWRPSDFSECQLCYVNSLSAPQNMGVKGYMQVSLPVMAYASD